MTLQQELEAVGIKTENDLQFPKSCKSIEILKKYNIPWHLFIHEEYKSVWVNVNLNPKKEN